MGHTSEQISLILCFILGIVMAIFCPTPTLPISVTILGVGLLVTRHIDKRINN